MHSNVPFYGLLRIYKLNNKIDMKEINEFQEFKVDIPLDIQINVLEEAMQIQQDYIKDLEEQLTLTDVSQQRELLFSFIKQYNQNTQDSKYDIPDFLVKDFLENNGG